ncbi:hypothetical protein V3851_05320 [Paenibacillus sp. M1]|uniref:Uncharacterized protein n=1 Tax=Paenibacillus haidiansis TaxID=1574488 RepID=A0ABU7VNA0_9BACL
MSKKVLGKTKKLINEFKQYSETELHQLRAYYVSEEEKQKQTALVLAFVSLAFGLITPFAKQLFGDLGAYVCGAILVITVGIAAILQSTAIGENALKKQLVEQIINEKRQSSQCNPRPKSRRFPS